MIYVGIDVAKDKHDCFITNSSHVALFPVFTIKNSLSGFDELYAKICSVASDSDEIKVGLEATGHYSFNLLGYLLDKGLPTYVLNPLQTNQFKKGCTLRKTKTDKVDARTIARMLMSGLDLKSYSKTSYHNEVLKSLTRYRFSKVQARAKLKVSISRLVNILFPELSDLCSDLHTAYVHAVLFEFPSAARIAACRITRLTNLIHKASQGVLGHDRAMEIKEAAKTSIGSNMLTYKIELQQAISLVKVLDSQIEEIEEEIKRIMDEINSPILSIPGIGLKLGAAIIAEIGDFSRFDSADKIIAYSGLAPTIYQSGKYESNRAHMEKRGSRYLRYALLLSARYVCMNDKTFGAYLQKKRDEGKHYNVAVSHAAKKLVRVIFALVKGNKTYIETA